MSQKFFAVIQDAREGAGLGIHTLALVDRAKTKATWWTSDDVAIILKYRNESAAVYASGRLKQNNARVVDYEYAANLIAGQQREILFRELGRHQRAAAASGADVSSHFNETYDDDHPFSGDALGQWL